jgi:ADP-heptose:LPS heptosyltransferase
VALDRPVVSVFGPTDLVRVGPYRRPHAVVHAGLDCAPCCLRQLARCPHNHTCMERVSPQMVLERLAPLLARRASA